MIVRKKPINQPAADQHSQTNQPKDAWLSLEVLQIASPCPASWDGMRGDDRQRFCGDCKLHVYNVAGMTRREAEKLINRSEGRICLRLVKRADGTVLTQDCPLGLRAIRRRLARLVAAMATLVTMLAFGTVFARSKPSRSKPTQSPGPVQRLVEWLDPVSPPDTTSPALPPTELVGESDPVAAPGGASLPVVLASPPLAASTVSRPIPAKSRPSPSAVRASSALSPLSLALSFAPAKPTVEREEVLTGVVGFMDRADVTQSSRWPSQPPAVQTNDDDVPRGALKTDDACTPDDSLGQFRIALDDGQDGNLQVPLDPQIQDSDSGFTEIAAGK